MRNERNKRSTGDAPAKWPSRNVSALPLSMNQITSSQQRSKREVFLVKVKIIPYLIDWQEMNSTGTNRTKAAYPIDTSDEITTTPYNVSWPTKTYNVTIADWTATWTKSDEEKHSSTRQHEDIVCNTTFCAAEGKPRK
ncbi:hypothetical protein MRX96_048682 [Rhipicephalus microplus]